MKRAITKWLPEATHKNKDSLSRYFKTDLEEIYKRFVDSGATYCEIVDDEVEFYTSEEETDEAYNLRLKNQEGVKKLEFERAKEIYLKLKEKYE